MRDRQYFLMEAHVHSRQVREIVRLADRNQPATHDGQVLPEQRQG